MAALERALSRPAALQTSVRTCMAGQVARDPQRNFEGSPPLGCRRGGHQRRQQRGHSVRNQKGRIIGKCRHIPDQTAGFFPFQRLLFCRDDGGRGSIAARGRTRQAGRQAGRQAAAPASLEAPSTSGCESLASGRLPLHTCFTGLRGVASGGGRGTLVTATLGVGGSLCCADETSQRSQKVIRSEAWRGGLVCHKATAGRRPRL